jgi:hypothetical protein
MMPETGYWILVAHNSQLLIYIRGQRSENRGQRSENRGQMTEDRGQITGAGNQIAGLVDSRNPKSFFPTSEFFYMLYALIAITLNFEP